MSDQPGSHLEEEPQSERGAPGSRDTGSDEPAGGPVDRPSGTSDADDPTSGWMSSDNEPSGGTESIRPQDTEPAVPPYEGRRTSADIDTSGDSAYRDGATVGGATGPVVNETPRGEDQP